MNRFKVAQAFVVILALCSLGFLAAPVAAQSCEVCSEGDYGGVTVHWWHGSDGCLPDNSNCFACSSQHCGDPTVPHADPCPDVGCNVTVWSVVDPVEREDGFPTSTQTPAPVTGFVYGYLLEIHPGSCGTVEGAPEVAGLEARSRTMADDRQPSSLEVSG